MLKLQNNQKFLGWLLVLPALIIIGMFIFYPMLQAFSYSFVKWDFFSEKQYVGLSNYKYLIFDDLVFRKTLINTFYFTLFNVFGSLALALSIALVASREMKGVGFFRTMQFVPVVIPMAIAGIVWKLMFEPSFGAINSILEWFGLPTQMWLFDKSLAMPTVILLSVWKDFGLYMIIFVGGLQKIPGELYEAIHIDGANRWQAFWKLTLPMLKPTTFFVTTMLMINSFKVFDQVWVMTQGGPGTSTITLVTYIYQRVLESVGIATAASVILFVIVLILMFLQYRIVGRDDK
ncbi:ABC-type sugar transport system permease subunit [Paenibacillus sp. DS2015]|uniref:carbohydrate ABC transporter permease n=1 Tax=Paenibacillus sp. DS2015 TaxID=3373917 RepID=UPI003D238E90